MDYKEQIEQAKHAAEKWREKHRIVGVGELRVDCMVDDLTRSITDLLARAAAAEARAEKAERERDELFRILNDVCQDVRAKSADEYVCGLCEYDGAHIGESGDWVNECPGFEKDDCFCIKKSMRKKFGQKEE